MLAQLTLERLLLVLRHHATPRTSICPVTAAVINAARRSRAKYNELLGPINQTSRVSVVRSRRSSHDLHLFGKRRERQPEPSDVPNRDARESRTAGEHSALRHEESLAMAESKTSVRYPGSSLGPHTQFTSARGRHSELIHRFVRLARVADRRRSIVPQGASPLDRHALRTDLAIQRRSRRRLRQPERADTPSGLIPGCKTANGSVPTLGVRRHWPSRVTR